MTPDQRARRIADHMLSEEGTGPHWGLDIIEVRVGYAKIAMTLRSDMLNGHRTAHGGMIFSLADTAFAYACNGRNETTVAAHAAITFLSPGREGETLAAEAVEQAIEGRSGVYTVTVTATQGRVVAVFQGLSRKIGGEVVRVAP